MNANKLYSSFVANMSNNYRTVLATGTFHKPAASSLGLRLECCLASGSHRFILFFPSFQDEKEISPITPTHQANGVSLCLPVFHTRPSKPDCLGSALRYFLSLTQNKILRVPWLLHEVYDHCSFAAAGRCAHWCSHTSDLATAEAVGLRPTPAGLTFSRPFVSPSGSGSQAVPGHFLYINRTDTDKNK